MEKIENNFINLLKKIEQRKDGQFSGIGLIIYDSTNRLKIKHLPLKPEAKIPEIASDNYDQLADFLINISADDHPWHDGFHLLNEQGELTHIAQFVETKIADNFQWESKNGARYASALLNSLEESIIMTGIIGKNYEPIIFKDGKKITV